jgi:hypothetical protein
MGSVRKVDLLEPGQMISICMIEYFHFVKFHKRLKSTDFVLVVVLVLDKIMIPEDEHENEDEYEYEKYQIRSPESALI